MIPRYTPKDAGEVWSDAHRVATWLRVELAHVEARAELGLIPDADATLLRERTRSIDPAQLFARALELELTTRHDFVAFLWALEEAIADPASRHVHYGLTSSDALDSAFAINLGEAAVLISNELERLEAVIERRAQSFVSTPIIGRSHGMHAEPTSFGLVLGSWLAEVRRNRVRFAEAALGVCFGKLSGAVGTSAHLPLEVERRALQRLGLEPEPVATQVVPRDRHAAFFTTLAVLASSLERFSLEVRHLSRSEVGEVAEAFGQGQKGSSAMPHKRNPIASENISGLARLFRGWALAALENVALWHERDISHSSVERVIAPDACITMTYALRRWIGVVDGLVIDTDRMSKNLTMSRGLWASEAVLLALIDRGFERRKAHDWVQRLATTCVSSGRSFEDTLLQDTELMRLLTSEDVQRFFDVSHPLRHATELLGRAQNG